MSGLDLSAAIEAADREIASYDARVGGELLYGPESDMPEWVVRKAAPLIAAQVREQIAAEIEAERLSIKGGDPDADIRDEYDRGRLYGMSVAASIARGTR